MTGAVDGTMILKRDRGQTEATLFVTGRDVEHEQQVALSFDATTALWTLVGNAEEVGCTRARQEILDLLREQGSDGMSAREIAEALEKNYHTTRSLLRKMEDAGEVKRSDGQYFAVSLDAGHRQGRPSDGIDHQEQRAQQQPTCSAAIDYVDYTDYDDYADYTSDDSFTEVCHRSEGTGVHQVQKSISVREDVDERQQGHDQREHTVINRHQCNHCNRVINVITFTSRQQQWEFETQAPTGKTMPHVKNKQMPFCKGIVVFIIRGHSWCVLIPPVRRGATRWIAGIATGS